MLPVMTESEWDILKDEWGRNLDNDLNPFKNGSNRFTSMYATIAESLMGRLWIIGDKQHQQLIDIQKIINSFDVPRVKIYYIKKVLNDE